MYNPIELRELANVIKNPIKVELINWDKHSKNNEIPNSKRPVPATLEDVTITDNDHLFINDMDENGVLYGTRGKMVVKSDNYNESWVSIAEVNTESSLNSMGLRVTKTGRIIVGDQAGNVFVSDEDQTEFNLSFTFAGTGRFVEHLGHCVYDNIVILSAYGNRNAEDPPREVFLSQNYGESFKKIFEGNPEAPESYHIHDCQYDPYDKRLWLAVGDDPNTQLYYSDDMGENWEAVFGPRSEDEKNKQITVIMPFEHGIIFGSDAFPDGLYYLPREKNKLLSKINRDDFIIGFYDFGTGDSLYHFAVRPSRIENDDETIYLIPFYREHNGQYARSRLLASSDGLTWYEIYRDLDGSNKGFKGVIGFHADDEERRIFSMYITPEGPKIFKATVPKFIL